MVGQKILMDCRFLDLPCGGAIPYLTGKKQTLVGLSFGFRSYADISALI